MPKCRSALQERRPISFLPVVSLPFLLPIPSQFPGNCKSQALAQGLAAVLIPRTLEPPCRCDSERSPNYTRYLCKPAATHVRRGRWDVLTCFLSSHLLLSLSPQADPCSEPKGAGLDKRGRSRRIPKRNWGSLQAPAARGRHPRRRPRPQAPGKAPYPPPLFLLGRDRRDGEVGATTPPPPGTELGCD